MSVTIGRKLKQCYLRYKLRGTLGEGECKRWEADYQLVPNDGLFEEYLEMGENLRGGMRLDRGNSLLPNTSH